ncbi:MAG: YncE family protein, partial [Comamonadaceae bacterium]
MRSLAHPTGRFAAFLFVCAALLSPWAQAADVPPLFVLNSLDANVSVINPVDWTEKMRIPTGKEPHHIYMTPDEKSVIVANSAGDSL